MILKGDTERDSVNIIDPGTTSHTFGSLERDTNHAVKMIFELKLLAKLMTTQHFIYQLAPGKCQRIM